MPWYSRSSKSSSSYRAPPRSVWQQAGATLSMNNACAQYGLTEEQIKKAELECQWRNSYGNLYPVLKVADVVALRDKLRREEEETKVQALKEKLGEEGYRQHLQEEQRKADDAAAAKKTAADRLKKIAAVKRLWEDLSKIGYDPANFPSSSTSSTTDQDLKTMSIGKTAAKSQWWMKPHDFDSLTPVETTGRNSKYSLYDVIETAERKHLFRGMAERLQKRGKSDQSVLYYAIYRKNKFHQEEENTGGALLPIDVVQEARSQEEKVMISKVNTLKAQLSFEENRIRKFQAIADWTVGSDTAGDSNNKALPFAPTDTNTTSSSCEPALKKTKVT